MEATYERPEVVATYRVDELAEEAAVCTTVYKITTTIKPPD
jgi:hypothetical protein